MLKKTASLADAVTTIRELIDYSKGFPGSADAFDSAAQRLCVYVEGWKDSRYKIPAAIDGGLAISAIVEHRPRKHPPTTSPREFDTLFFAALFLLELAGMRVTFQWLNGRYYLRGEISSKAGDRAYVTRIILNASPAQVAQFNEDHHSYRLRDLVERNGGRGGMLPDGELGRQAAIDRCNDNYTKQKAEHHADLSPDAFRALLIEVFAAADTLHGRQ